MFGQRGQQVQMLTLKQVDVGMQDRLSAGSCLSTGLRCPLASAGPQLCWQVEVLSRACLPHAVALGRDAMLPALPAVPLRSAPHVSQDMHRSQPGVKAPGLLLCGKASDSCGLQ